MITNQRLQDKHKSDIIFQEEPVQDLCENDLTLHQRWLDRLGSPTVTTVQRTVTKEQPFRAGAGRGAGHRPPQIKAARLRRLLQLPQPGGVDGVQVGVHLADFAPQWRSLLGNCRATGIVEEGVGLTFH